MNQYAPNPNRGQGEAVKWLHRHAAYGDDVCLIWPFTRSVQRGYGKFGYNGEAFYAHRYMCELVNGPPPSPQHQASHSCGKGHKGCVNPRHLSWATNSENQRDRRKHGTASRRGRSRMKLTPDQIAEIRASRGRETIEAMAARFGVKRGAVEYWLSHDDEPSLQSVPNVLTTVSGADAPLRIREIVAGAGLPSMSAGYSIVGRMTAQGKLQRYKRGRYGLPGQFASEQKLEESNKVD